MTSNDTFKTINEINHKSVEFVSALDELNLRIFERLAARQVDVMNLAVEHAVRLTKLATEPKASLSWVDEARVEYQAWFKKGLDSVSANNLWCVPTV